MKNFKLFSALTVTVALILWTVLISKDVVETIFGFIGSLLSGLVSYLMLEENY